MRALQRAVRVLAAVVIVDTLTAHQVPGWVWLAAGSYITWVIADGWWGDQLGGAYKVPPGDIQAPLEDTPTGRVRIVHPTPGGDDDA